MLAYWVSIWTARAKRRRDRGAYGCGYSGIPNLPKSVPFFVRCRPFFCDGVALVEAQTRAAAEEGARRVQVRYEELPHC
jgi:hypothetical protein